MSFAWLGTFRQGQWQAYRSFVLRERRNISSRIASIEAEMARIGEVTVYYKQVTGEDGKITTTEQRTGFAVTAGSSLERLVQAYVAQGGNPLDISLFLQPDSVVFLDEGQEVPSQPYGGVLYPKSGEYVTGGLYKGGQMQVVKNVYDRIGGFREIEDSRVASLVDQSRRWVNQTIREKLELIEARIIKLSDLREQLQQELDDLSMAAAGTLGAIPSLNEDRFDARYGVANIVATLDGVFYTMDENNTPDFSSENEEELDTYYFLLSDDVEGQEDNTAL